MYKKLHSKTIWVIYMYISSLLADTDTFVTQLHKSYEVKLSIYKMYVKGRQGAYTTCTFIAVSAERYS